LRIVIIATVVNLVTELVAVYWLKLGVAGSAGSTVVTQVFAAGLFLMAMHRHLARARPSWARARPLLRQGRHLAIRSIAMYTVWNVSTLIAAYLDAPTLAANQVVLQLFIFLALVLDALAIPLHSLVAGELGSGEHAGAAAIGRASVRLSLWCALGLGVLLVAAAPFLPSVFTTDPAVRSRLIGTLLVLAVMQIPGAIAFALDGALIGAQGPRCCGRDSDSLVCGVRS
jgi:Na+-driven multidrug efflux pump